MKTNYDGTYVLVRTRYAGAHFGRVKEYCPETRHIVLQECRWLWEWEGAFTPYAVALDGIKDGKLTIVFPEQILAQVEQILPLSDKAKEQLYAFPIHVANKDEEY